jgi:tetratricopeptide (TPR) repeat protein
MRLPYSGTPPDNVQGLVTGSVQIIGDQVRIAASLEDTRSRLTICCDTFDSIQRNIFATQKQVARALVEALNGNRLTSAETSSNPADFDAQMAYSLADYLFDTRDHNLIDDALEQFKKATELDPDNGDAWLGLAYTYIIWPDYGFGSVDREAMYDEAIEAVEEGIAADPGIEAAAGTVYGFVNLKRKDWTAAEDAFEMAIRAATGQPIAYHWYSYFMAGVGRLDAALEQALQALRLDPDNLSAMSRIAILSLYNNDIETATYYFNKANEKGLENYAHSFMYSLLLYHLGQFDEAKANGKRGLALSGSVDTGWFDLIIDGSREPELRPQAIATLDQVSGMNVLPANAEMFFWMLLDEVDRALEIARRLEREDGLYETELLFTDEFRAMRQHSEFAELIDAIGLAEYWASAGCTWSDDRVRCQ